MTTMNLSFPTGATDEELKAILHRGFEAIHAAHAGVVDCGPGGGEEVHSRVDKVGSDDRIELAEEEMVNEEERTVLNAACDLDIEDPRVCSECGEYLCVFDQNELRLMSYGEDEHFHLEEADVPTNNIRRKKLYRQHTLILNGAPMGVGIRRPLPTCCVRKIREMFPSDEFMGFRWE
jgi:hypothetical protein